MNYRPATPADIESIAAVHVASWRTTYAGLLPAEFLAGLSVEQRKTMWTRHLEACEASPPTCAYVAETADGRVVGFASGGREREPDSGFVGELYAIYLLEDQQGRGAGRELARRVVGHLRSAGLASMRVWVLDGNPAAGFYQRLGGVEVGRKPIRIGEGEYIEIAYGWRDIEDVKLHGG